MIDFWSNALENRLLELYARDDVVDIFWGQPVNEHLTGSTLWYIYVVTRDSLHSYPKKEILDEGQVIYFIAEEDGFAKFDDDSSLGLPKIPQDLQEKFEKALDNELGPSFRELHYNLVGMSTGYKRTGGLLTKIPAIILYVHQKGILRRGCDGLFNKEICGFPTDVVEACIARPCYDIDKKYCIGWKDCQSYQKDVMLGSSIGIGVHELEKGSEKKSLGTGSLGVAVCEKKLSKRVGFVTCEHVINCDKPNSLIYRPSLEELLDAPNRRINELEEKGDEKSDIDKLKIKHLKEEINLVKETLDIYKFGIYEFGMRKNHFFEQHNKSYGIDAAFCVFNNENRMLHTKKFPINSKGLESVGLPIDFSLTGFYTLDELNSFDDSDKVFKIGQTTGLTIGKWLPGYLSVATEIRTKSIEHAKEIGEKVPPYNEESQGIFIGYMKSQLDLDIIEGRKKCFPTIWFDRQLAFEFKPNKFDSGDSGASVIDENGKAFGMLHAKFETNYFSYGIATPYFAVFEALNVEICLSHNPIKPTTIIESQ